MADGSVGSVFLDLVVRDTVDKQISDLGSKATASAKKIILWHRKCNQFHLKQSVRKGRKDRGYNCQRAC